MSRKPDQPQFESWGRYPKLPARVVPLYWTSDFPFAKPPGGKMLPVGMGRSYGDSGLLANGTLLCTRLLDRLQSFDAHTGVLRCEAGITLGEILTFSVPRGWFLPVTAGTKYVTLGGAIANDIHGKNHHVVGSFGRHVRRFELVRSDGARLVCSPEENAEWFRATIGGLGLTGLIAWAEIQLRPIASRHINYEAVQFHGIEEFIALSNSASQVEYNVAWVDGLATGRNFARGLFMLGSHSPLAGPLRPSPPARLGLPVDLPQFALNRFSIGAFNALYFRKHRAPRKTALIDYEPFFYPLDGIRHWNRLYGKAGFLQFQCVLPWEPDHLGLMQLLKAVSASGLASFLAVLKVFGTLSSGGMLSFPMPGITLAMDFANRGDATFDLLDRMGRITAEHGGRIYPAKDARMTPAQFQAFYPQWRQFASFVDPAFSSSFWERVTARA